MEHELPIQFLALKYQAADLTASHYHLQAKGVPRRRMRVSLLLPVAATKEYRAWMLRRLRDQSHPVIVQALRLALVIIVAFTQPFVGVALNATNIGYCSIELSHDEEDIKRHDLVP